MGLDYQLSEIILANVSLTLCKINFMEVKLAEDPLIGTEALTVDWHLLRFSAIYLVFAKAHYILYILFNSHCKICAIVILALMLLNLFAARKSSMFKDKQLPGG